MSEILIDILVKRISQNWINPKTGEPLKLEDINDLDYRNVVEGRLK